MILSRVDRSETLLQFVRDAFVHGMVSLIHLEPEDLEKVTKVIQDFNLDFDDAYQYVAAEKFSLEIVSFDSDFDRTEKGRKTPAQVRV